MIAQGIKGIRIVEVVIEGVLLGINFLVTNLGEL